MECARRRLSTYVYLVAALSLCITHTFAAQNSSPTPSNRFPYLARLQHGNHAEDACALINIDGGYRFERRFPARTDVFIGKLSVEQIETLRSLLNQDSVLQLSAKDASRELTTDSIDLFMLDVFRADGLQHLKFLDRNSRKQFQGSIGPIVSWFDELRKLPHVQIAEANASRCMPGIPEIPSEHPDTTLVAPAGKSYVLTWSTFQFHGGSSERSCIIVYAGGRSRMEKSKQNIGGKTQTRASEGMLSSSQVGELEDLIGTPELITLRHEFDQSRFASDVEVTQLTIPRATTLQRLSFGSYFNVLGNSRQPGGISNLQYGAEEDRKLIKPLEEWLKKNIEKNKSVRLSEAEITNCAP